MFTPYVSFSSRNRLILLFKKYGIRIFSWFSIVLLTISIFPWSIRPVFLFLIKGNTNIFKHADSVFPRQVSSFSSQVQSCVPEKSSLVFLTKNGQGEKDFFMLSALLFPRKIYWVSNKKKGPISWWNEFHFDTQGIHSILIDTKTTWFISYTEDSHTIKALFKPVLQSNFFMLWKKI